MTSGGVYSIWCFPKKVTYRMLELKNPNQVKCISVIRNILAHLIMTFLDHKEQVNAPARNVSWPDNLS